MHEFTPSHLTYPFTPHPLFTESGHTHIDYADFLKSKMLHYADNTCLTGRNWVDVNIQKLTIFHFKKLFFSCHSCWVEEEEKRRSSCLGGIVSASIASVDNDVCNIFLSFPHEARSLASFTFCGIVFEENILIFINVRVHATFFFFWHALNIQHHPQVKSINSFRLHESGDTVGNAEEITVFWWTPGLEIFKIHMWLSLRQVSLYFSKHVVFRFFVGMRNTPWHKQQIL